MFSILLIQTEAHARSRTLEILATDPRLSVGDAVDTLAKARVAISRRRPGLIIADLRLADGPLVDLLVETHPESAPPTLALTQSLNDPLLLHTLRHGADAYLAAGRPPQTLLNLVHSLHAGESPMTPDIAREVLAHFSAVNRRPVAAGTRAPAPLSEDELRVLQWTGEGYLTQEIARGLSLTPHQVGVLIRALYRRMHMELHTRRVAARRST